MEEDLNIDMNAPIGSYLDPIREMTGEQLKQQDEEEKAAEEAKAAEPQGLELVVSETSEVVAHRQLRALVTLLNWQVTRSKLVSTRCSVVLLTTPRTLSALSM